ncbi:MAG: DUF899 family protein [Myxococcota bacterium]
MDPTQQRMADLHQQIRAAQQELASLLRKSADGPFPDAVLQGPDGDVRVSELFGDHEDLILSFNMGTTCAYCTLWADEANGVLDHLLRRAAFVVVSPDPPSVQQAFAAKRGWRFAMVSDGHGRFAVDEGFAQHDGARFTTLTPGFVTVRRTGDGLRRTGRSFYGPGDPYCSVYHFFDLLEDGPGDWQPVL